MAENDFEKVALHVVDKFEELDAWSDKTVDRAITAKNVLTNTFHLIDYNWQQVQTAALTLHQKMNEQQTARTEAYELLHSDLQEIHQVLADLQQQAQQQIEEATAHLAELTDTLDQFAQQIEANVADTGHKADETAEAATHMAETVDESAAKIANFLEEAGEHIEQDAEQLESHATELQHAITQHASTVAQDVEVFVEHLGELHTEAVQAADNAVEQEIEVLNEFWTEVNHLVLEESAANLDVALDAWDEEASSLADDINTKREHFKEVNDALIEDVHTAGATLKTVVHVLDELKETLGKFN